jgi:hypothetical protein
LRARDNLINAIPIEPADWLTVEQSGRGEGAIAQAVDRFDVKIAAAVSAIDQDAVTGLKMGNEFFAPHGLTGFGAAKLQHSAVDRQATEIMIKAHHAQRLRFRDIEGIGHQRDSSVVYIAKPLLQIV